MTKRAIIEMSPEALADGAVGYLIDSGLRIVGSAETDRAAGPNVVRLVIEGDTLPPETDGGPDDPLYLVVVHLSVEAYGRQRLVKVASVEIAG